MVKSRPLWVGRAGRVEFWRKEWAVRLAWKVLCEAWLGRSLTHIASNAGLRDPGCCDE